MDQWLSTLISEARLHVQHVTNTQVAGRDGKPVKGDSEAFLAKLREAGF